MAEIQLRNIGKRWGSFVGVNNFDLTIADREFLVLLGPSGCGKTTTMRLVAGLEEPTAGDIYMGGRRINDLEPKDRDVAMVFQNYALFANKTAKENIMEALVTVQKRPKGEAEQRALSPAGIVCSHAITPGWRSLLR